MPYLALNASLRFELELNPQNPPTRSKGDRGLTPLVGFGVVGFGHRNASRPLDVSLYDFRGEYGFPSSTGSMNPDFIKGVTYRAVK